MERSQDHNETVEDVTYVVGECSTTSDSFIRDVKQIW